MKGTSHLIGAACLAVSVLACGRNDSTPESVAQATDVARDSASGEVAQYALMKNSTRWLTDSNIVSLASTVNQAPVNLARIEAQLWSNPQIHDYAVEVLRDHQALQTSIDSLAGKRRIPSQTPAVAESMSVPYDSVVASLAGLPLEQMEPKFIDAMVALHSRTVKDFAALAGNATDPDLRMLLANRAILMEQTHVSRGKLVAAVLAKADSAKQAAQRTRTR